VATRVEQTCGSQRKRS